VRPARLRREQPVERQHQGDAPQGDVLGRTALRVAAAVDHRAQPLSRAERQPQGPGAQRVHEGLVERRIEGGRVANRCGRVWQT